MKNTRIAGLDIIKALAAFFVVSVHFLLNTNFYKLKLSGFGMYIFVGIRNLLLTCVPLFLLATGYLNRNKEPNKEYYKGIIKVLISYVFICVLCIIFRKFYFGEEKRLLAWAASIFNFSANGYSWYIEMYIGLFLLIPYLNILYKSLETKKKKTGLIFTFLTLTSVPSIINGIKLLDFRLFVMPDWWINLYPISYYFLGSYIAEHKPQLNSKKIILYIIVFLLVQSNIYWAINKGGRFYGPYLGQYQNIITLIISVLIFILFYNKDIKNKYIKELIFKISKYSLDLFLFSYIIDLKIYSQVNSIVTTPKERVFIMIPTVILSFTLSFILAYLKNNLFELIQKNKKST